ncbi:PREDICTED: growth-regulating factor 7 [Ipomoea nil]|uniref:growth-regulating factor 7 n=1 Tax=Ipomoea nil TaxID=35883 RepID=UPI000901469C|nr:PREDICTED: growth-regulating factor 7 [Ipomoea nil]
MENGAGGGGVNGFGVPDKETASAGGAGNGNAVVGSYGLGENNIMMGRHVHHHHHHGFDGGGSGGGGAGPTSGANENSIYMYGDDVATAPPHTNSSVPPFTVGGGAAAAAVAVRLSQAFNCSNTAPLRPFKSPGMATSLGFPFTCAQWKELERQAMVYKYMMASLPVPPDLLLPLPTDAYNAAPPSFHTQTGGSSVLGFSGKNRDLEPGRCKRTDGKKWRCSKEVAPNQKYCERHLHRGRPRSRKPVEDHNNTKKTRLQQPVLESPSMVVSQPANPAPSQLLASSSSSDNKQNEGPQCLDSRMDHSFSISPFNESHRSLDWEMAAMGGGGTEEQLQQLMAFESNVYRDNAQILQQMSLFHCKDYYGECNLYFNPDLGSLNKEFINAWANGSIASNTNTNNTDTGSCAYALSLAMAAGNTLDSEMGVEGGNAGNCDEEDNTMCSNLTLRSPVSWVPFASGGPLAEVLKPSQQQHHHHPSSSSYISNGDSISPAGTTVSSPSGVLQKTNLFSQSDGSVCNSPTVAASELVPFQWLS